MKNKKLAFLTFVILPIIAFTIIGFSIKSKQAEHTMDGIVEELYSDTSILITKLDEKGNPKEGDLYVVRINKEKSDSKKEFAVGEEITIYYDGLIAESYPAQINNVYKISKKL